MRALVHSGASLRVEQVDRPVPGKGQLLIRVRAVSLNRADYADASSSKPVVVGSDVAGVVEATGPGTSGFAVGDRVCAVTRGLHGACAEYAVASAAWTAHIPAGLDDISAAALPSAGVTALAGVRKSGAGVGDKVAVMGASGGVGQYATLLLADRGASVTAVCNARNGSAALGCGASKTIDYASFGEASYKEAFDSLIAVNGPLTAGECCSVLKPGGTAVVLGLDFLSPSLVRVPLGGRHLRIGLFFSLIGKGALQEVCDTVAASSHAPSIERIDGFDAAIARIQEIPQNHPRGKIVMTLS